MEFRPLLTALRQQWEQTVGIGAPGRPADGFFVVHDLRVPRRRANYSPELLTTYARALSGISSAMREGPIRHAGPGQWTVFPKPQPLSSLADVAAVPGALPRDECLVVRADLWRTFQDLSLWVEALCIHEWCLFTERATQKNGPLRDRGEIYRLLTDRPANRRPLTWERHQIDLLIMEGQVFVCPWTSRCLVKPGTYELDHIVPLAIYPINELWNLVPADPDINSRKSDKLPSPARLAYATPQLAHIYGQYGLSPKLSQVLLEDLSVRFSGFSHRRVVADPAHTAQVVRTFVEQIAASRNLARF